MHPGQPRRIISPSSKQAQHHVRNRHQIPVPRLVNRHPHIRRLEMHRPRLRPTHHPQLRIVQHLLDEIRAQLLPSRRHMSNPLDGLTCVRIAFPRNYQEDLPWRSSGSRHYGTAYELISHSKRLSPLWEARDSNISMSTDPGMHRAICRALKSHRWTPLPINRI